MKLSIGIPTYNRLLFLKETLDCLTKQLEEGVEIIISDNGSTDGTREFLQGYQKTHQQIRYVGFETNQGIDANIVNVIKTAKGEYLFLFSDDDLLCKGALQKILQEIEKDKVDVICLNHFSFKDHDISNRLPDVLVSKKIEFDSGEKFFAFCGLGFISSLIVKRDKVLGFLPKVRFGKECAHVEMIARVALQRDACCVFRGDIAVGGRSLPIPRYDLMASCVIHLKELYDELLQESLLSPKVHRFFIRRLIFKEIPRIFYKLLYQDTARAYLSLEQVTKIFGKQKMEKVFLLSIFYLNKKLIRVFLDGVFFLLQMQRKLQKKQRD